MSSSALESQGMVLQVGNAASPEVFTTIPELTNIAGPGGTAAVIDVTDLSSTAKEKRMGLTDEGQVTATMNYIPANTVHAGLRTDRINRTLRTFRIVFTDSPATIWTFTGYVLGLPIDNAVDGVTTANLTIEVSGSVTES